MRLQRGQLFAVLSLHSFLRSQRLDDTYPDVGANMDQNGTVQMSNFSDEVIADKAVVAQLEALKSVGFDYKLSRNQLTFYSGDGVIHHCYNKMQIYEFSKQQGLYPARTRALDHSQVEGDSSKDARIAELEATLKHLRERGRLAVAQRDEWERRALAAESMLANGSGKLGDRAKFETLKRFIAKEFHPDHSSTSGFEKLIRTEMFKLIWVKVEEIDRT